VARFSSEVIQKILFFECVKINWFDLYNHRKGENEADAFEYPENTGQNKSEFKAKIIERQQLCATRFSFAELINLSRSFRF
jgi:hypothetical protein